MSECPQHCRAVLICSFLQIRFLHGNRRAVACGKQQGLQPLLLHQRADIGAHTGMDRPVAPGHRKAGGKNLSLLKDIIGDHDCRDDSNTRFFRDGTRVQ